MRAAHAGFSTPPYTLGFSPDAGSKADGFAESVLDIPNPDISERVYGSAFAAKVSPLFCSGTYPVLAALPDATSYQRVGAPR